MLRLRKKTYLSCECNSHYCVEGDGHTERLVKTLQAFSKNPDRWYDEWVINPNYIVDLGQYGAGRCMCGHMIKYQYQFLNKLNHKTFPVGSVCVNNLGLPIYIESCKNLMNISDMANVDVDAELNPELFVSTYKKDFSVSKVKSLGAYKLISLSNYVFQQYKAYMNQRKPLTIYQLEFLKETMLGYHAIAKSFIEDIHSHSRPVSSLQVDDLKEQVDKEIQKMANAKQLSLF